MVKKSTDQLVGMLDEYFSKLPPLPRNWRDIIVKIIPWIALIFGLFGVLGSIASFGALTFLSPAVGNGFGYAATSGFIGTILAFVSSLFLLMAFPGLKSSKKAGWNFLFWSETISILSSLVAFTFPGVVMGLIGLYLIFQIKSYYK